MLTTTFTDVLGTAQIRESTTKVSHEAFGAFMEGHARAYLKSLVTMKIPIFLMIYFILSCVGFFLDLIGFFVGVSQTSNQNTIFDYEFLEESNPDSNFNWDYQMNAASYGAPIVLIIESVFITLSLWYIVWAVSYLIKLPGSISGLVV
jgi:hypothetical protein